ncbi:hypothetical protein Droror1_Dr00015336 [Drosera rotundifolia]
MAATPKPFADYHVLFKKGSQVEVSLNEPGLVGSWYTATVLRPISYRTNLIHVRYDTLLSDGSKADEEIPLEESVHAVNVRPVPPRGKERQKFRVDEDVDAFDEDGWWEGVVVGVLKGGKYEVYFRCSREQMVFGGSELRVHREWVKGEWVPPVSEEEEEEEEELVGVETRLTRSSARKRKAQGAATEEKGGASSSGKGKHKELQLRKKVVPLLQQTMNPKKPADVC